MACGKKNKGGMTVSAPKSRGNFPLKLSNLKESPKRLVTGPSMVASASAASSSATGAASASTTPDFFSSGVSAPINGLERQTAGNAQDHSVLRLRMVERLRQSGIQDERVLAAMAYVPRHLFVDAALVVQAYEDNSLPIGLSQTISKPSVVARMIELMLRGRPSGHLGKVLEIGTGCGYQAAVLSELGKQVFSVERLRPLHDKARENLAALRRDNLRLIFGDGMLGHPPNAPYDTIISAAGGETLPSIWIEQLALGGRLIAPIQIADDGRQALIFVERQLDGTLNRQVLEAVKFVPLKSGIG